ncbi:uncharacterized protein LOC114955580 [Acropora millepora]|uniref:uncharacterized protein LOC114955580 n=1 Tax=Acropora millepora TaxID=45264 RepID=UPI001CF54DEB|nr:uncharacterized protein LOC114955580 [Acropora millepora]
MRETRHLCRWPLCTRLLRDPDHSARPPVVVSRSREDARSAFSYKDSALLTYFGNSKSNEVLLARGNLQIFQETQDQTSSSSHKGALSTVTNRFQLQEPPMSAAKQNRKDPTYDRLRKRIVDSLDELFWKHLTCSRNLPQFEVLH